MIRAQKVLPGLSLDIYGEGNIEYENMLKNIVRDINAESFITFKGLMDVSELYYHYDIYISASLGETLGLTCMEAVGSGNAMIGLDVRYGNRLFIKNHVNGRLIDFSIDDINKENIEDETIEKMKDAIVEVFGNKDILLKYQNNSYEIAGEFINKNIERKWLELFNRYINNR